MKVHVFKEVSEIFADFAPKILSSRREKEQKEEVDSRHKFRARMDFLPCFPSTYEN